MQTPSILATLALTLFSNLAGADDTASTLAEPATLYPEHQGGTATTRQTLGSGDD